MVATALSGPGPPVIDPPFSRFLSNFAILVDRGLYVHNDREKIDSITNHKNVVATAFFTVGPPVIDPPFSRFLSNFANSVNRRLYVKKD